MGVSHGEPLAPILGAHLLILLTLGCIVRKCAQLRRAYLLRREQLSAKFETAVATTAPALPAERAAAEYPIIFVGTGTAVFAYEFNDDGRMARLGPPVPVGGSPTWVTPDKTSTRLYVVDVRPSTANP